MKQLAKNCLTNRRLALLLRLSEKCNLERPPKEQQKKRGNNAIAQDKFEAEGLKHVAMGCVRGKAIYVNISLHAVKTFYRHLHSIAKNKTEIDIEIPFVPEPARQVVFNEFNRSQCPAVHTLYIPFVSLLSLRFAVGIFCLRLVWHVLPKIVERL